MKISHFITLMFLSLQMFGQHPHSWLLTEDEGLPSNVVYDLLQDEKGYIWIGTDRGLVKYDGTRIKTYTSSSQKSSSLTNLCEDQYGRIWCVNFSQQLFYVQNDSLVEVILPSKPSINGHVKAQIIGDFIYLTAYDFLDRLELSSLKWDVGFYDADWPEHVNGKDRKILISASGEGANYGLVFSDEIHLVHNGKLTRRFMLPKSSMYNRCQWFKNALYLVPNQSYEAGKATLDSGLVSVGDELSRMDESARVLVLSDAKDGALWACTSEGAFPLEQSNKELHFFPDYQVSKVIRDREGNYWVGTLQHGVRIIPEPQIRVYNSTNSQLAFNEVNCLGITEGVKLSFGSYDGQVQVICKVNGIGDKIDYGLRKEVNGFGEYLGETWAYGEHLLSLETGEIKGWNRPISVKQAEQIDERTLGMITSDGFAITDYSKSVPMPPIGWNILGSEQQAELQRIGLPGVRKFGFHSGSKTFLLATTQGLFKLTAEQEPIELKSTDDQSLYSTDVAVDGEKFWISTVSQGVFCYYGDSLYNVIRPSEFGENTQLSVIEVNDPNLWIVGTDGVFRFNIDTGELELFDKHDGLPTSSVNDLVVQDGTVWLATMRGLVSFPSDFSTKNLVKPRLVLNGVLVNSSVASDLSNLDYTENNLSFDLSSLAFRSQGNNQIRYRLIGQSEDWTQTRLPDNGQIPFLALSPGDYSLEAKAINEDGVESELISIPFSIGPPFWQTWWFYLTMMLIVGGIVSGIFLFRIRELRKRDKVQHDLRASELTALKAQMNPHFVFNALNSIQEYILLNETELANDYLGKFARLMRRTLDQSQQQTVSFAEELDLLNLYLELEAIRFEDGFEYAIKVDGSINPELVEIPSMIIQPFVENAIKHGLLHKKDDRELSVEFRLESNVLVCLIEDNGIGLKASQKLNERRKETHRSFGTGAVKKRLDLLNEDRKQQISVDMTDKSDFNPPTSGTLVTLRIPVLNQSANA